MGGRAWKKEEDDLLRKVWGERGSLKVHAKLFDRRDNNALHIRGKRLGLPPRMSLATDRYSVVRQKIAEAFESGFVGTVQELCDVTGQCEREVLRRVTEGHGTKYRICDWVRKKAFSDWTAVYELGTEPDEPRPATQTNKEKRKRHNEKRRISEGRVNPFAALISQVTTGEKISMTPRKGSYGSRVHYMDEAA